MDSTCANPWQMYDCEWGFKYLWRWMDWVGRGDVILLAAMFLCVVIVFSRAVYRCYLTRHQTRVFIRNSGNLFGRSAFSNASKLAETSVPSPVAAMVVTWVATIGSSEVLDNDESIGMARRAFWRSQRDLNARFIFELSTLKSIAYVAPFLGLAGACLVILSGLSKGFDMEKHAAIVMLTSEIVAALVPTTAGVLAAVAATLSHNYLCESRDRLQSDVIGKALEAVMLIAHSASHGKRLAVCPSWCDRENADTFRFAQCLPLTKPFSGTQTYALLAAPNLGIVLAVLMAFLSFRTPVGLSVRLLKPDEETRELHFVPAVVIRSPRTGSHRENALYVNANETSWEKLAMVVNANLRTNSPFIYVEAEGEVSWQTVANAIDTVNAIPATVVLVTKAPPEIMPSVDGGEVILPGRIP